MTPTVPMDLNKWETDKDDATCIVSRYVYRVAAYSVTIFCPPGHEAQLTMYDRESGGSGGRLTLTRYDVSADEAAHLVLKAAVLCGLVTGDDSREEGV